MAGISLLQGTTMAGDSSGRTNSTPAIFTRSQRLQQQQQQHLFYFIKMIILTTRVARKEQLMCIRQIGYCFVVSLLAAIITITMILSLGAASKSDEKFQFKMSILSANSLFSIHS